jgi:2-polyprenyl-6-methoxyphenol hydroxylase-like FAD-dependent oxidoreductase
MVDVLIVGAGPTGLTAAIAAVQQGLSVRIVDANVSATPHSKALVLHSRSLEVFDDLGCVQRILAAGREFKALNIRTQTQAIARIQFDQLAWNNAPYPMWFTLPQSATERCLEEHLATLGVVVERECRVTELTQREGVVQVSLSRADGAAAVAHAAWVVGADGARSEVRRLLNIALDGDTGEAVFILADVALDSALPDAEGFNILSDHGVLLIVPLDVPGRVRLIAHMPALSPGDAPTIDQAFLQRLVEQRCVVPMRVTEVGWTSQFVPKHLLARSYRVGRVFLAGDAAHLHSPVGGQGLNTGVQDAYNLLWKLALAHRGHASSTLLDSYTTERRAVAESMVRDVDRATHALTLIRPLARAVRNRVARLLLSTARVQNRLGPNVGMLHVHYAQSAAVARTETWFKPRGPHPGDRAPLLRTHPALFDALRGPSHTLLLLDPPSGALDPPVADALGELALVGAAHGARVVHVVRARGDRTVANAAVVVDADGEIRAAYGATGALALWIRPDKYVGFRGSARSAVQLRRYLAGVFSPLGGGPS